MRNGDNLRARADEPGKFIEHQLAAIVDGRNLQLRAFFLAQNLPGHDVGVVLHGGDEHFVASADVDAAVGLRNEVDGLGSAADKDDFARVGGVQKFPHRLARRIVRLGCAHAERVNAAMNVGVHVVVVIRDGIEDNLRLLRSGSVIEIDQRFAVDALSEDGEVGANPGEIEAGCASRRSSALRIVKDGLGECGHPTSSQLCVSSLTGAGEAAA